MITAVVFDIGGVLEIVDDATWPEQWRARWRSVGVANRAAPTGPDPVVSAESGFAQVRGQSATAEMSEAQVRETNRATFGLTEDQADAMMVDLWNSYCGRLDVEMRDFAAALRPRYRTAILSNSGDGARRQEQRRYDFAGRVDTIVYSHEVGVAKPDAAIYALTADRVGARPEEIVFVDDSIVCVDAARAAGWHAVHHVDTARSIRAISAILDRAGSRSAPTGLMVPTRAPMF